MPLEALLSEMSIDYRAPDDARHTDLADSSIDVVTSTNTLEHIPPHDIVRILTEMRRILRPRGILSVGIDYQDHYSYFGRDITVHNCLRYSDRRWRWFNNDVHFQNRLRHDDHLGPITGAGFRVVDAECVEPTSDELDALRELSLAEPFACRAHVPTAIRSAGSPPSQTRTPVRRRRRSRFGQVAWRDR